MGKISSFYKLLSSRLKRVAKIDYVGDNQGIKHTSDQVKAQLLANHFANVHDKSIVTPSSENHPKFPEMSDSMWFHADKIYEPLSKWPAS